MPYYYLWETWHRWQGKSYPSPVSEINEILDSQRRFQSMLADGDVLYSRTDLRMFIDKCRADATSKILAAFNDIDESSNHDIILHAAARLQVTPQNIALLITEWPELVRHSYPKLSLPLHFAAAAVGSDHANRVKPFLTAYPDATKRVDEHGLLPMQLALIQGADYDVIKLLVDSFPPALEYPFFPRCNVPKDLAPFVGLLPFHIACCRNFSLDVIFHLLVESPDSIKGANCSFELELGTTNRS